MEPKPTPQLISELITDLRDALEAMAVRTLPDGSLCFCADSPVANHDAVCEQARAALGKKVSV